VSNRLLVKGAGRHNLRDVSEESPGNSLVVFKGVSGSGKSSQASDTVFTEGRPRYMESLSADARQFLGQLDEPATGPYSVDAERLPAALHRVVDDGNTVVVEHHPDVVTTADRLIGRGPEGSHRGRQVIAAGTPEQIAAHPGSHTGGYLGALLEETL
jgi:excinuclease UvrABC ATPase subunit